MLWTGRTAEERHRLQALESEIELKALDMGVAKYRKWRRDSDASIGTPEKRLIGAALQHVIPAIEEARLAVLQKEGGAAKGACFWGYPFWCLDPEQLAVIAVVEMFNNTGESVSKFCNDLGSRVEIEYQFRRMKEDAPKLIKVVSKSIKNWTPRQVRYMRKRVASLDEPWPLKVRGWVGYKLLEVVLHNTELFEYKRWNESHNGKRKTRTTLVLQPDVAEELDRQHSDCEILKPYHMPMVVPPADWGPEQQGGYVHHSYTLVKAQNLHEPGEYPDEEIHGPVVYSAVNGLQRTGWRINRKVLEVMQQVWAAGGGYAGLPTADPLPLPDKPAADATDEAVSRYRLLARQTHDENARIVAKRKNTLAKLRLAAEFVDCEEFFFPYQLDYRGRIYPVAPDLHPQADDIGRGLLEFSNGKRLGSHGLVWLKVRLANSFGVDDVSFADRVAWVDENWNRISLVAQDPMGFKWWTEAEDPWQALATCFELVVPEADLVSHLPVNVDGSCNGLQHFAAMQRDPVGAAVVNLVPKPKPDGIYYVVADKVQAVVDRDCLELQQSDPCAADDDPAPCQEWKATGVTKPVVKRGTMTLPYGVTKQGMQDQFIVDGLCSDFVNPRQCAIYMRDVLWDVLGETVQSAREVMDWLKLVAGETAKAGVAIRLTTPAGFKMRQEQMEVKAHRIVTLLQTVSIYKANPDHKLSVHRQKRCLPPNFVHSMDGAHLQLTVHAAKKLGIGSFAMIHDSFGTHACDLPKLNLVLRMELVKMYLGESPLVRLAESVRESGVEIPDPPARGDFDIRVILDSDYAFG